MKAFFAAIVAAAVIATGAMYVLDSAFQRQADQAFTTGSSVRLPDHGNIHNLVGKSWSSATDHVADEQHFTGEKTTAHRAGE